MKKYVSLVFFLLVAGSLCAQEKMKKRAQKDKSEQDGTEKGPEQDDSKFSWRNVRVGGNLGAAFGTYTYFQVAPVAGYVFNEKLFTGVSATYIYQSQKIGAFKYEQNIYGLGTMVRYNVYEGAFLTAEYEALNFERYDPYILKQERVWAGSMFLGGGYIPSFSNFKGPYIMALYNLNYTLNSPYSSPWVIRIGILL